MIQLVEQVSFHFNRSFSSQQKEKFSLEFHKDPFLVHFSLTFTCSQLVSSFRNTFPATHMLMIHSWTSISISISNYSTFKVLWMVQSSPVWLNEVLCCHLFSCFLCCDPCFSPVMFPGSSGRFLCFLSLVLGFPALLHLEPNYKSHWNDPSK